MAPDFKRVFGQNGKPQSPVCHSRVPACSILGAISGPRRDAIRRLVEIGLEVSHHDRRERRRREPLMVTSWLIGPAPSRIRDSGFCRLTAPSQGWPAVLGRPAALKATSISRL